jgi:uncharacterized protein YuzE
MKKSEINFDYDAEVDAAYLKLKKGPVAESEEVRPGIVVDYDASHQVVGVEILRFTKRFASHSAIKPGRTVERLSSKRRSG